MFSFVIKNQTVPTSGCIILRLTSDEVEFLLLCILTNNWYCEFFFLILAILIGAVSYCCFNFYLNNEKWCVNFHMLIFHVYIFCGKVTFHSFCSLLNRSFCFWCCILKKKKKKPIIKSKVTLVFSYVLL